MVNPGLAAIGVLPLDELIAGFPGVLGLKETSKTSFNNDQQGKIVLCKTSYLTENALIY